MFGTALWACPPRALPSLLAALRALTLHVPPSLQLACARRLADLHIRNRPGPAGRMERDGQVTLDEREFVQAEPVKTMFLIGSIPEYYRSYLDTNCSGIGCYAMRAQFEAR